MKLPLVVLCIASCLAACDHDAIHTLTIDDRVGRLVPGKERPELAGSIALLPGDLVLESDALRVVIGGNRRAPSDRGSVLELRLRTSGIDQSLSRWSAGLQVGERELPLAFGHMELMQRDDRPVARIALVGVLQGRVVHVDRELALSATDGVLGVATSVWVDDDAPVENARVVEHLDWDGATPFAPGFGETTDELGHDVPWVARDGRSTALAFGYVEGVMRVRTRLQPHGSDRLPGTTRALSPTFTVQPGRASRLQAFMTAAHHGVSDAVRRWGWARAKPFAEARVRVPYAPPGTLVRIYDTQGRVLLRGRPSPDGHLIVPLPDVEGRERLTVAATAWGHAATTPEPVSAGQSLTLRIPRGGSVHVVARDESGRKMPARIRFESLDSPKKKIELGPDHHAGGARDAVITVDGDVEIPMMPGRFRVLVSRGPEYALYEQEIAVTESFQPQVSARLPRVIDPGPWIGADFHLHSSPSPDSQVTLEDRVAALTAEGVRFAVPTDHDHVTSLHAAIEKLGLTDLGTVPGLEVTTSEPVIGHFNAYPYPLEPALPGNGALDHRGMNAQQIFAQLHAIATQPLVQVNHPRMELGIGYFDVYGLNAATGEAREGYSDDFDVLEVWNGFDLARPEITERVFADWLALLSRGRRVVATGNSDSHTIRSQWAGYPRTYIHAPLGIREPNQVIAALRAGHAFVTNGPFLEVTVGDTIVGDVARANDGNVKVRVRVSHAPWMRVSSIELWVGGQLMRTEEIPAPSAPKARGKKSAPAAVPVRFDKEVTLPIVSDTFVVVRVRGSQTLDAYFGKGGITPMAFTNPIFVDMEGDGVVPWIHNVSAAEPTAPGSVVPHAHDDNGRPHAHEGHVHQH